ncbi:cochlin [Lates japonicus]|uniref:Cochlin n=1 Tax=Lates japonicus TaxID=270547 RepID=A0AAD3NC87_LATJO|nr:cochlin [Lates japonicus]
MSLLSALLPLTVLHPVTCATRGADLAEDGVVVLCPKDCTQWRVSVFGTGVYASVSSVCGAAVHRGPLGAPTPRGKTQAAALLPQHPPLSPSYLTFLSSGGAGSVRRSRQGSRKLHGRHIYISSYAHGIQSQALSQWGASFSLTKPVVNPLELTSETSTTALPTAQPEKPARKPLKKPIVKKVPVGENKDCQMDIAMVIDSSNNIGRRRFSLQKNFVGKLAATLRVGSTGPHIGLIQASDSPRTEFLLTNYLSPKDLLFAIRSWPTWEEHQHRVKPSCTTAGLLLRPGRAETPQVMVVLSRPGGVRRPGAKGCPQHEEDPYMVEEAYRAAILYTHEKLFK